MYYMLCGKHLFYNNTTSYPGRELNLGPLNLETNTLQVGTNQLHKAYAWSISLLLSQIEKSPEILSEYHLIRDNIVLNLLHVDVMYIV